MSSNVKQRQEKKRLGERLVDAGLIDEIQLAVALGMQKQTGLKIGKQLLKLGFISEEELSPFLSEQTDMSISLAQRNITAQTIRSMPQELAFKYKVIPVAFDGKTIVLAMGDPKDITVIDDLAFRLGKKIHPVRALEWDIDTALLKYYSGFTDDELSKLTSSSSSAEQYHGTQWLEKDEQYIELSKGIDAQAGSYDDLTDLLEQGDTPDLYMPANDSMKPNPLHELESKPGKSPAPQYKEAQQEAKRAGAQTTPTVPEAPPARKSPPAPDRPKTPQRPQPAQPPKLQKVQAPQAAGKAKAAENEQPSAAGDAVSALANTARKRFTIQQALIDLLVEKKLITERELLNKLLKLEGALGGEDE